jgi:hypothetical protein
MTVRERTILIAGGDTEGQVLMAAPAAAADYVVAVANGADASIADAPIMVSRTYPDAVMLDVIRLASGAAMELVRAVRAVTARPLLVIVGPWPT